MCSSDLQLNKESAGLSCSFSDRVVELFCDRERGNGLGWISSGHGPQPGLRLLTVADQCPHNQGIILDWYGALCACASQGKAVSGDYSRPGFFCSRNIYGLFI